MLHRQGGYVRLSLPCLALFLLPLYSQSKPQVRFYVDPATNSEDQEQRRTYGLNIVPPWPDGGFLFVNLPEHLEYMPGTKGIARHHDPGPNVWRVHSDGVIAGYEVESKTEPGVFLKVEARAQGDRALFTMTITNRSAKDLKSIRPLLCFQYHNLKGFPAPRTDNFAHTFVVAGGRTTAVSEFPVKRPAAYARMAQVGSCSDEHNWWAEKMGGFIEQRLDAGLTVLTAAGDDRKVAVKWRPGKNLLTNSQIPCIHADPCVGDLAPGESRTVTGEAVFSRASLDDLLR
jgi:hypothetical protein